MLTLPPPLAALAAWPQFVCWFAAPIPDRPGKFNKFPCHWQTGVVCDAQDPANWCTADVALAMATTHDRGHGSGVGFVFTASDPFFFADIDGALQADRTWSPLALSILARFPGAAVEVSHSGKGLHVFGRSAPLQHGKKNTPLGLELYTSGRFAALTGTGALGDVATDHTAALAAYAAEYFPLGAAGGGGVTGADGWTDGPVAEWGGPVDDDDLIARASHQRSAAAAFGDGVTFADLWNGSDKLDPDKRSEHDMALANHLAFWTGKDCARMERLMRRSALVRDKWDTHRTYLVDTIVKACSFIRTVAAGRAPAPVVTHGPAPTDAPADGVTRDPSREYMGPQDQLDHFAGCWFLSRQSVIYSLPRNEVLKKTSFDVVYGGHLFVIDPMGQKTTDSAWDVFTNSRVNVTPVVSDLCFRPELPSGEIISDGMRKLVNSYVPYEPRVLDGDPTPFLTHLEKMLPDARDRKILLSWMARAIQSPGRKLQWWPVLQGVEGNGKSSIINVLAHAFGEEYTHMVNVEAMAKTGNQFNAWLDRKLFVALEEINVDNRRDFLDTMKTVVTGERVPYEGKGANQKTGDNRANGVITTNYKEGMPIDAKVRRYGIFFCAQQDEGDLIRDGMTSAYFSDLRDWWRGEGAYAVHGAGYGLAVVTGFLRNMAIEADMDPAHHSRAPETSSTRDAIRVSLGRVEQEVLEAIDEGRPGFSGGWVSSRYLDAMIDQMRAGVPRAKRRALMQSLGYDWHPALRDGRTNDVVTPDGSKPKLYVRNGHLAHNLTEPAAVAAAYSKAQAPDVGAVSAAFGRAG